MDESAKNTAKSVSIPFTKILEKVQRSAHGQITECHGLGGKGDKSKQQKYNKTFPGKENVTYLDCDGGYTTVSISQNSNCIVGKFQCM